MYVIRSRMYIKNFTQTYLCLVVNRDLLRWPLLGPSALLNEKHEKIWQIQKILVLVQTQKCQWHFTKTIFYKRSGGRISLGSGRFILENRKGSLGKTSCYFLRKRFRDTSRHQQEKVVDNNLNVSIQYYPYPFLRLLSRKFHSFVYSVS